MVAINNKLEASEREMRMVVLSKLEYLLHRPITTAASRIDGNADTVQLFEKSDLASLRLKIASS
jgi:hypothetical protein